MQQQQQMHATLAHTQLTQQQQQQQQQAQVHLSHEGSGVLSPFGALQLQLKQQQQQQQQHTAHCLYPMGVVEVRAFVMLQCMS